MFLTVYTPTFRRPRMLEECKRSVQVQTLPCEHVIVEDTVGIGVGGMFADIPNHALKATGSYVLVLSDDNVLADPDVAVEMRDQAAGEPDVIMFKGDLLGCVQPLLWKHEPTVEKIDLSCFAVRRQVWQAHAADWGHRYEGDFDFIRRLWDVGYRFHWWDRVAFRALAISNGEPE